MDNILENNPIFGSRLGFEMGPARYDKQGISIKFGGDYQQYAKYHSDMHKLGVKLHISILFSVGVCEDQYDYSFTDRTLDIPFKTLPADALYIPRLKPNAPVDYY